MQTPHFPSSFGCESWTGLCIFMLRQSSQYVYPYAASVLSVCIFLCYISPPSMYTPLTISDLRLFWFLLVSGLCHVFSPPYVGMQFTFTTSCLSWDSSSRMASTNPNSKHRFTTSFLQPPVAGGILLAHCNRPALVSVVGTSTGCRALSTGALISVL